jgi:4-oxalocrotonate tautomerase
MPFARISYSHPRSTATEEALSAAVQEALVAEFGVPLDDFFQLITHHVPGGLRGPEQFLGIDHAREFVFVQITCAEGRSVAQKKALYASIANRAAAARWRPQDVIVNLVETRRENWSFGNGLAPFAVE